MDAEGEGHWQLGQSTAVSGMATVREGGRERGSGIQWNGEKKQKIENRDGENRDKKRLGGRGLIERNGKGEKK